MTRCHDPESCCAGAKNCPMPQFCNPCPVSAGTHKPAEALVQIEEPMNNTQKLNDEALQAYRATGLSPLEMMEQRNQLLEALKFAKEELTSLHNEAGEFEFVNYAMIDDAIDHTERRT